MNGKIKDFFVKYTMVIVLIVVFLLFDVLTQGRMHYAQNLSNLLLQNAYVVVLACGMLLCILTGGNIDLSVGAVVCMTGALAAQLLANTTIPALLVVIICLALGLAIGVFQGYMIGYAKIPPFITTLAGMFIFRGIGRVILDSKTVSIKNDTFLNIFTSYIQIPGLDDGAVKYSALIIGLVISVIYLLFSLWSRKEKVKKGYKVSSAGSAYGKMAIVIAVIVLYCWELANYKGIPIMLVWVVAVVLIYSYITSKTAFGRYFYAVGGNEKATKLSGINTKKVFFLAYANVAFLAGLCGMLVAARVGSVNGDAGTQYEMDAIGSCFIGGACAYGGSGTITGAVIGAVVMGVINQGMSIYGLNSNWQYVIKGAVILLAVIFDIKVSHKNTGKE